MLRVIVVGLVLAAGSGASAATFSVDVTGPAWQADALAGALRHDLAGHDLALVGAGARADLAVRVAFAGAAITYVVTREGTPPVRGAVALGAIDRRALANALVDAMHRLLAVRHAEAPAGSLALVLLLLGGLAWGAFVAACMPIAWPLLAGLHRVEHRELLAALRAWFAVALQRALLVALGVAPIVLGVWLAQRVLDLPAGVAWGVVLPIAGLAARFAWRVLVRVLAKRLDAELVDGAPSAANPWHAQVRGYLGGYLKRANLDVDETLLDRVVFLPGKDDDAISVYGGGMAPTRVVIARAILERALAPYGRPHDFAMPRVSTLHWTHWNSGLVMATEADEKLATREDRDPAKHATVDEGVHERLALGEPPTFTGIIEPVALDPRTQYRPGDDPLWLDWDPGEEFDGTDPGDKDFLFGVLVLAMGAMQRHEDRGATIALWWRRRFARPGTDRAGSLAHRAMAIATRLTGPVRRFAAARSAALADIHAALTGARHHVAQYHAWRLWRRDDILTSRAYVPELEATSRVIGAALERDPDAGDGAGAGALRDRLAQLRPFLEPNRARTRTRRQRLVLSLAMLAGLAAVAALAVQAVLYHTTYEQRLKAQRDERQTGHG